jgi:type I restriction enzyme S subunit
VGFHDDYLIEAPCIIIGRKGSAGAINWVEDNCYPIDTTFYIKLKTDELNLKFLFQYLINIGLTPKTQQGGVPGLNRNDAYLKKIPIPSLKEQECIVKILDKFDALVNDISIGLPAELSARRKQYEYYREKLLTFKEKIKDE